MSGFTVRELEDGKYQVTGSIPGWGAVNGRKSDQVRRTVHDAGEAETVRAELQAQRDLGLRKRVRAKGDQRLRTVETTLSRDEQRS
ncbi:MAG TPA: hypothetical protein VMM36_14155, partial [Opitutaceae bacterium]|nr:hypothetical protein [Opitutaceae bacterium]